VCQAIFHGHAPSSTRTPEAEPRLRDLLQRAGVSAEPQAAARPGAWFAGSAGVGVAGLLSEVPDVTAEAEFWSRLLRFHWAFQDGEAAWALVRSPLLRTEYHVVIAANTTPRSRPAMNDLGFPSVGVYTTSLDADCERGVTAGAALRTEPIQTEVGGRSVGMALLETPGGALVELLQVRRQPN
jgi:hypothetical protein